MFVTLKPSKSARRPISAGAIAGQLNGKFSAIQEAFIAMFPPPPRPARHHRRLQAADRGSRRAGYDALNDATKAFIAKPQAAPELAGLFSSYQVNVPQLYADIDRTKARQLGVPVTSVFDTMQIYLGSLYVNDFNKFGRTYSVRVQADAKFRARADDVGLLKVRSDTARWPPSALLKIKESAGRSAPCATTASSPPTSMAARRPVIRPGRRRTRWRRSRRRPFEGHRVRVDRPDVSEIIAGNSSLVVFPVALLLVFLVLAAQYESLTLPLSIIMIVPMGLLAAMLGVWLTKGDNNVFTQIGLIVLVGLSAKNAILIVEFARELEFAGRTPVQAAIEASRLRLRPILMTSLAFIMGVVPLVISRRRLPDASCHGGCGVFRHDRRHGVRHLLHADVLRCCAHWPVTGR